MATHRAIPGANLPASDSSEVGTDGVGQEFGTAHGSDIDLDTELPGETGLGSGFGANAGGFGAGDSFAPLPASEGYAQVGSSEAERYPRPAGVLDQVKQQASTRVNEQKVRAAEGLGSVATAIRQASEHLRSENQTLATYADRAVDQLQSFADKVRDKDPAEMMHDVERFARRNPTAFVGGAFLLGIGMARFLKSSGSAAYGNRSLVHRDSAFGGARDRSLGGATGVTGGSNPGRSDDLSRPTSTLGTDPWPGITS